MKYAGAGRLPHGAVRRRADVINPIYWLGRTRTPLGGRDGGLPKRVQGWPQGQRPHKICEDTDGDGKADKFTVFAEGFNIPTSMTFAEGEVILAHAPEFYFLKDDGDDKATFARCCSRAGVWATRTPARATCATGSQLDLRHIGCRFGGSLGGKQHNFGMGVFRFKSDASDIEFLHQFNNNIGLAQRRR